jgi:hypothetical protein
VASFNEIEHLLQGYIDGELGASQRLIVEQRVRECAETRLALERQQACSVELFETLREFRLRQDLTPYVMEHLPETETRRENVEALNWRAKHPSIFRERLVRLTPVFVLVLLVGLAFVLNRNWPAPAIPEDAMGVVAYASGDLERIASASFRAEPIRLGGSLKPGDAIQTGPAGQASLSILGSTRLRLAPDTRIRLADDRTAVLEKGKALFEVSQGNRLFRVATDSGIVTVYGTTFEVSVERDATIVTVAEGEVTLADARDESKFTTLWQNEQGLLSRGTGVITTSRVDAWSHMAWANAILPDEAVEQAFLARTTSEPLTVVQGISSAFLAVIPGGEPATVHGVVLAWLPPAEGVKHCAYEVIVRADGVHPLFKARIPGHVFNDLTRTEIYLPNTGDRMPRCTWVSADVYPDYSDGTQEVQFRKDFFQVKYK